MATQGNLNYYPGGFGAGVVVRGMPIVQTHPGTVWWVSNNTTLPGNISQQRVPLVSGSNGNKGTFNAPFATINYALSQASAGDIVMVKPGHAETIADATTLVLSKAGVAIVGLGAGSLRPTLTFTAATANVPVTAANVSIQNFLFVANFADVASFMTATGTSTPTDFEIAKCEFRDTSSILNALTVFTGNATANSCDGFRFVGNRVSSLGTTAATTALKLSSATNRVQITDNFLVYAGAVSQTAIMLNSGANDLKQLEIARNVTYSLNTDSTNGSNWTSTSTACTGVAYDNYFGTLDATASIWVNTGTKMLFFNNYSMITSAADKSALINPVAV